MEDKRGQLKRRAAALTLQSDSEGHRQASLPFLIWEVRFGGRRVRSVRRWACPQGSLPSRDVQLRAVRVDPSASL